MAFKKIQRAENVPESPEKLFTDLPRRKIGDVQPHQQEVMRMYVKEALNASDVALQLPTGSGKTLVGLMIGEWRRRKNQEKVVYLCPTIQLVNQVVEQADEQYGLSVNGFTGPRSGYDPVAKAQYKNGERLAVTTYSSLFNVNPYFDDADVIIIDDAHAADNYISKMWSMTIDRTTTEQKPLHDAFCGILKPLLEPIYYSRLTGSSESIADYSWVDKIPTPDFLRIKDQITEVLDVHAKGAGLEYSWTKVRDHLESCHLYISSQQILIRPLISPTWTHAPFVNPKQRIYMSATLGSGGDLERMTGRSSVVRLPIHEDWNQRGVGRRFFIFPEMSLSDSDVKKLRSELMKRADRSLSLVPTLRMSEEISNEAKELGFSVFGADDIEGSKKVFIHTPKAAAVVANRYDGIDFPGEECRLLFVEGLPSATNLQERFLMSRMGANILFNERIQTRVLQAIGRCTRSLADYSAVVISGDELPDYLADKRKRQYLHPDLQAEIFFGIEQSMNTSADDIVENFSTFIENGEAWEEVNKEIVSSRKTMIRKPFPAMRELENAVKFEIGYQEKLWQKDYEGAFDFSKKVLGELKDPELRGYRALWHYLSGSAAHLAFSVNKAPAYEQKSLDEFASAKDAAAGISWLVRLARKISKTPATVTEDIDLYRQVEKIEAMLVRLGTTHERKFAQYEKIILEGIVSRDYKKFETAHKVLGDILGFETGNVETEGAPDPWWVVGDTCIVFEDHSDANEDTELDVKKARQVASHPNWIRANVSSDPALSILPVLVTPVQSMRSAAAPHLKEVMVWPLAEFQEWAKMSISLIREIRKNFSQPGDLSWKTEVAADLKTHGIDVASLKKYLLERPALGVLSKIEGKD